MKKYDTKVGWFWVISSFNKLIKVSESWVITDDVILSFSRGEFAVAFYMWCRWVEGRFIGFSNSFSLDWHLSINSDRDLWLISETSGRTSGVFSQNSFEFSRYLFLLSIRKDHQDVEKFFVYFCHVQHHVNQWPSWRDIIEKSMGYGTQYSYIFMESLPNWSRLIYLQ